jgi:hypothetical protein
MMQPRCYLRLATGRERTEEEADRHMSIRPRSQFRRSKRGGDSVRPHFLPLVLERGLVWARRRLVFIHSILGYLTRLSV